MDLDTKLISQEINTLLWNSGETVSTAESCTAGRIAAAITAIPGSSDYFRGGLICYANNVKIEHLGVDEELIEKKTAVCEEVAREMVTGALRMFGTTYSIAITGFAGPSGDPSIMGASMIVGTIWIAVSDGQHTTTQLLTEDYGRERNLERGVRTALTMLKELILQRRNPKEEE